MEVMGLRQRTKGEPAQREGNETGFEKRWLSEIEEIKEPGD